MTEPDPQIDPSGQAELGRGDFPGQEADLFVARVQDLADEIGEHYDDDMLAVQAMVEGTVLFAAERRMDPALVAEEFALHLAEWRRDIAADGGAP